MGHLGRVFFLVTELRRGSRDTKVFSKACMCCNQFLRGGEIFLLPLPLSSLSAPFLLHLSLTCTAEVYLELPARISSSNLLLTEASAGEKPQELNLLATKKCQVHTVEVSLRPIH